MTAPHDDSGDQDHAPLCLTCLHRPARPGSLYCSRLCRWLDYAHRLGLF